MYVVATVKENVLFVKKIINLEVLQKYIEDAIKLLIVLYVIVKMLHMFRVLGFVLIVKINIKLEKKKIVLFVEDLYRNKYKINNYFNLKYY